MSWRVRSAAATRARTCARGTPVRSFRHATSSVTRRSRRRLARASNRERDSAPRAELELEVATVGAETKHSPRRSATSQYTRAPRGRGCAAGAGAPCRPRSEAAAGRGDSTRAVERERKGARPSTAHGRTRAARSAGISSTRRVSEPAPEIGYEQELRELLHPSRSFAVRVAALDPSAPAITSIGCRWQ